MLHQAGGGDTKPESLNALFVRHAMSGVDEQRQLLQAADAIFGSKGAPTSAEALQGCILRAGAAGLLALSSDVGGPCEARPILERLRCLEQIARTSNEVAFLCQQHIGAVALINAERGVFGTDELLRVYAAGRRTIGIAASHLRGRGGVYATAVGDSYHLRGSAAWVSGYGIFDDVLIGARTLDGRTQFHIVPFANGPGMHFAAIDDLWAMTSTSTVSMEIDCVVERSSLVSTDLGNRFGTMHGGFLYQPVCHVFGVVYRALLELSQDVASDTQLDDSYANFVVTLARLRRRFYLLLVCFPGEEPERALDEMLALRAEIVTLAFQLVASLCALTGGKSLLSRNRLTSLIEEILFFSTTTVDMSAKVALAGRLIRAPGASHETENGSA